MSKIGRLNLELMEQAEELGFSTTQEALDNGYHVVEHLVEGTAALERINVDDEYQKAHEAWLVEKNKILNELYYTKEVLNRAIEFIGRVKYE